MPYLILCFFIVTHIFLIFLVHDSSGLDSMIIIADKDDGSQKIVHCNFLLNLVTHAHIIIIGLRLDLKFPELRFTCRLDMLRGIVTQGIKLKL